MQNSVNVHGTKFELTPFPLESSYDRLVANT